jgi:hypothetical protein
METEAAKLTSLSRELMRTAEALHQQTLVVSAFGTMESATLRDWYRRTTYALQDQLQGLTDEHRRQMSKVDSVPQSVARALTDVERRADELNQQTLALLAEDEEEDVASVHDAVDGAIN